MIKPKKKTVGFRSIKSIYAQWTKDRKYHFRPAFKIWLWTGRTKVWKDFDTFLPQVFWSHGYYFRIRLDHPDPNSEVLLAYPICNFIRWEEKSQYIWTKLNAKKVTANNLKEGDYIWGYHDNKKIPIRVLEVTRKFKLEGFLVYAYAYKGNDSIGPGLLVPYLANGVFIIASPLISYTIRKIPGRRSEVFRGYS